MYSGRVTIVYLQVGHVDEGLFGSIRDRLVAMARVKASPPSADPSERRDDRLVLKMPAIARWGWGPNRRTLSLRDAADEAAV